MTKTVVSAVLAAIATGTIIGIQGGLVRLAGRTLDAARVGMLVNVAGGALSLAVLLALGVLGAGRPPAVLLAGWPYWAAAGVLGTGILVGMAFALPRVGIAAGLAGVLVGQLAAAVAIDTIGWGAPRIPLSGPRALGLALLLVGVVLVLPRR